MTHLTKTALSTLALLSVVSAFAASATPVPGAFHALGAPTSGTAVIVHKGSQTTLELRGLKTEVGPDLQVWLYAGAAPKKGTKDTEIAKVKHVKVGELKKFSGTFSYILPAGTKVNDFKSVVIWCDQVMTAFGAADLK